MSTMSFNATPVVEWNEYAEAYDTMCAANPAYQENLSRFRTWLDQLLLLPEAKVCDVGAGTGNYVVEVAKRYPTAHVIHLDNDPMMNRTASRKYRTLGTHNVGFVSHNVLNANVELASLDLIVCVNALYTFGNALPVLERYYTWLKPRGHMFLIDLGRPMDVGNWSRYIIGSLFRKHGLKVTLNALLRGRKAFGQNSLIRREQERGNYWLHSTEAFKAALTAAGFAISRIETCYRGVCDLAICSKPAENCINQQGCEELLK